MFPYNADRLNDMELSSKYGSILIMFRVPTSLWVFLDKTGAWPLTSFVQRPFVIYTPSVCVRCRLSFLSHSCLWARSRSLENAKSYQVSVLTLLLFIATIRDRKVDRLKQAPHNGLQKQTGPA